MSPAKTNFFRSIRLILPCAAAAILAACADQGIVSIQPPAPPANLVLYNTSGAQVMLAEFKFPDGAWTPGRNFTGTWRPIQLSPDMPKAWTLDQNGFAKYHVEIASKNMSIDLSLLESADYNLFLLGNEKDGVVTGQWSQSTPSGLKILGKFALYIKPPPVSS